VTSTELSSLEAAARAWLAEDPDPDTRAELEAVLAAGDGDGLRDRFGARLEFGTAGLRGAIGAGPNRMNRALVRRAAAGLAAYLLDRDPRAAEAGVAVGFDARHKSDAFAADTAAVMAGAGIRAFVLPRPLPTPVLAFAVRHLGCAAGVMVTASHNPPADNGYKVYLGDGAQIVPPADRDISAAIDAVGPLAGVPLAPPGDPRITTLDEEVLDAYLAAAVTLTPHPEARTARIAATPLHGVGCAVLAALLDRAGFPPPAVVAEQAAPDPDFPTVAFPNPEEPGVLDLVLALAGETGADLVLANDPDADRLAVAVPDPAGAGGWRVLRGDEVGWLLGDYLLGEGDQSGDRLVASSLVSSRLLGKLAAAAGARHVETLTGFKWIVRPAIDDPSLRFVFGYEEALGYAVGDLVRDKDGLTAALAMAELSSWLAARGETVVGRLEAIARRFGLHATDQWSVRFPGLDGIARRGEVVAALAADPPGDLAGDPVVEVEDLAEARRLPPADGVVLSLASGGRVIVRPSGTEPKLKVYFEVVEPVPAGDDGYAAARRSASDTLARLRAAITGVLGL
jgi:phosphomannomutase